MAPTSSQQRNTRTSGKARRLPPMQPRPTPNSALRLLLVWGVLVAGQLGLLMRLVYLQVKDAPSLQNQAQLQQRVPLRPKIALRSIADRNGNLLAVDEPAFTLFAHPYLFKQSKAEIAAALAPILQQTSPELLKLFDSAESGIPIVYDLSEEKADQVRNLGKDGLELIQQWQRIYPQRELTANIIGYVDADHKGQAGLEYSQQNLLKANSRLWKISEDGEGFLLPDLFPLGSLRGDDLTLRLTLDLRLQRAARTALRQKLQQYKALRGTTIVMDVHSGQILALASEPSFDPQQYYAADSGLFKNWAVSDLYEPGSTFKPINVAIALDHKAIQPNEIFYDEGRIFVGGWPIQNNDFSYTGARGPISVSQILEYSSNVGMVHIVQKLKPSVFYQHLQRLGLGEALGSDLPFETPGQFKDKAQFLDYPIEPATTAFGQGFSVTPMQMVQLHAAIANGGKLVTPYLVEGLINHSGKLVKQPKHPAPKQVFSPETTQQVLNMMGNVVKLGTGKPAQIPGYRLGGKTGTAQKAIGGAYSYSRITSFVALFPLESPRYVVFTVVDEPKGDDAFGSTVAAPVVKAVLETLITTEGIPPSHPEELQKARLSKKATP